MKMSNPDTEGEQPEGTSWGFCDRCGGKLGDTPHGTLSCRGCDAIDELARLRAAAGVQSTIADGDDPLSVIAEGLVEIASRTASRVPARLRSLARRDVSPSAAGMVTVAEDRDSWRRTAERLARENGALKALVPDGTTVPNRGTCDVHAWVGRDGDECCPDCLADRPGTAEGHPRKACPDGGTCHHWCDETCFRAETCEPLSSFGDTWPSTRPVDLPAAPATPEDGAWDDDDGAFHETACDGVGCDGCATPEDER